MEHHTPISGPASSSAPGADTIRINVPFVSGEYQSQEIRGDLVFEPTDPFAVQLVVGPVDGPTVTWSFARDLLAQGLYDPAGDGDVLVWPCLGRSGEAVVVIELRSPNGAAMLQTPSRTVQEFVADVFEVVPEGHEHEWIDFDQLVAHLLAD